MVGNWLDEDISVTRYGHSRKTVQGVSLGSQRGLLGNTIGRILRHTGAEVGFTHIRSTVRVYRGGPKLLLKASLRRQNQQWYSTLPKWWIASAVQREPFSCPSIFSLPLILFRARQPSEWLRRESQIEEILGM